LARDLGFCTFIVRAGGFFSGWMCLMGGFALLMGVGHFWAQHLHLLHWNSVFFKGKYIEVQILSSFGDDFSFMGFWCGIG
jgi:hypothetical protein